MEQEPKKDRIEDAERLEIVARLGQRLKELGQTSQNKEVFDIGDAIIQLGTGSAEFLANNRANFDSILKDVKEQN